VSKVISICGVLMIESVLLAFFIILPKIGMLDFSLIALAVLLGVSFFVENESTYEHRYLNEIFVIMFGLMVVIFGLSVTSLVINGGDNYDEQFLFKPFRMILLLFSLYYIFNKRNINISTVLNAIIFAALLNALVIYIQYVGSFIGGAGDFLQNPNFNESVLTPYRKAGLMSGFPVAGILSFCGSMISLHFFVNERKRWHLLLYVVIGLTCFLTARTALLLFILGTFFYLLQISFKKGRFDILVLFTIVLSISFTYAFSSDNDVIIKTRDKMFANVINYISSGDANDYSTNDLLTNHYVFPSDFSTFMIGNSIPPENNIVNTDVSFFRITWNNGFFSMLLYVFSYLFMWFISVSSREKSDNNKFIIFLLFAGVFISNFKGFYFFSRVIGDLIFIIFISCIVNEKKSIGNHG